MSNKPFEEPGEEDTGLAKYEALISQYLQGDRWEIPSTLPVDEISIAAAGVVEERLKQHGWSAEADIDAVTLSFREVLANALRHGAPKDTESLIAIDMHITPEEFHATITDEGAGFDWQNIPDPRENPSKTTGRGVFFMRNLMDSVTFSESGNSVTLSKKRS